MRDQQDWTRWFNEVNFFKIGSRISKIGLPAEFQNRLEIITASLSYSAQARFPHVEILLDPSIALKHFHRNIFFSWNIFYWLAAAREKETFHWLELISGWLGYHFTDQIWYGSSPWCLLPIRSAILTPLYQTAGLRTVMSRTRPALQWEENWETSPLFRSGWRLQLWTWWGHWGNQYRHHTPQTELKTWIIDDTNSSHIYLSDFKILPGTQPAELSDFN